MRSMNESCPFCGYPTPGRVRPQPDVYYWICPECKARGPVGRSATEADLLYFKRVIEPQDSEWSEKLVKKSRKLHTCDVCGNQIKTGSSYWILTREEASRRYSVRKKRCMDCTSHRTKCRTRVEVLEL